MLVPQAIAYATLAGMPPHTGLYAALFPAIIGVLWGSSPLLAVGPVALTSLLVFGSLSSLAVPGSAEWVGLAIWLSLYAGVIQFLLGALKLGGIANLVSQPVVTGFINAAGLIIIFSQLPKLLGLPEAAAASIGQWRAQVQSMPLQPLLLTATFGCGALLILLGMKRFLPRFPGILFVALLAIALSWGIGYAGYGGAIVGTIPPGLPSLQFPGAVPIDTHRALWPAALILALVSFTEAMSSCRVMARARRELWNENQELIGQGLAKVASAICGSFPVSGSFSRSALNIYSGAVSAWSTLFASLCVLLSLLFLTDVIYYLPQSVLAAMIIVPVFGILNFPAMRRLFLISVDDGLVAAVTFMVTLFSMPHLYWGVFAGTGIAMTSFLYRRMHPRIIEVAWHEDGTLRDRHRFHLRPLAADLLAVRMDSALNFVTATSLERFINMHCRENQNIRRVLFCAGSVNDIDSTGVDTLESIWLSLNSQGIELQLSAVKKQVYDVLDRAGLVDKIGRSQIFATDRDAVSAAGARLDNNNLQATS